jgi:hypothetical protein
MEQPRTRTPLLCQQAGQAGGADTPNEPPVRSVTLIFDTSLSADELRRTLERAWARDERFNQMVKEMKEIAADQSPEDLRWMEAVRLWVKFMADDPEMSKDVSVTRLLWSFLTKLGDDVVHKHSMQSDGLIRARPADYTLIANIGRGYLIAAVDILQRGGMQRSEIKTWLKTHGVPDPKQVFEWRYEMRVRARQRKRRGPTDDPVDPDDPVDRVVEIFEDLCPRPRGLVARAEAERHASRWAAEAYSLNSICSTHPLEEKHFHTKGL